MIFRDFLFKIPKKYLVVIIVFLTMFLIKSNVFAQAVFTTVDYNDTFMNNLKSLPEYQSGNYYVICGGTNTNTNNCYFIPKTFNIQNFYFENNGSYSAPYAYNIVFYPSTNAGYSSKYYILNNNGIATSSGQPFTVNYDAYRIGFDTKNTNFQFYSTVDIYTNNNFTELFYQAEAPFVEPFITTNSTDITNWTFSNLTIDGGSLVSSNDYGQCYFSLEQIYNDTTTIIDLDNYYIDLSNGVSFSIPRELLVSNNSIVSGRTIEFNLIYTKAVEGGRDVITYSLGTYTFGMSSTEQDNINNDKTQQSLDNIYTQQQQTTNSINNLNDNITNDNVSNSVIQQPSMPNDTSGVENGVNNIFTTIMNSFTNFNSNQDIVFPIPFTNKNITINGNYTRDMLTSVNASWVINIITIFWWYLISVYIVKDVLKMVDKIQEGKIDNIENSNIKGDML